MESSQESLGGAKIRWRWLRLMYVYTIVLSGMLGLGILVAPQWTTSVMGWSVDAPIAVGIVASVYVAFGVLAAFGLRKPLTFVPVLLLQLLYKVVWLGGVFLPLLVNNRLPETGFVFAGVFASYIVGDVIAIPFRYLFSSRSADRPSLD